MTLLKKTFSFLLLFLLWILAGAWLLTHYSKGDLLLLVNSHYFAAGDFVFYYLTFVGEGWTYIILIGIFVLLKKYTAAWMGLLSFALSSLASYFLKTFFYDQAPRPAGFFGTSSPLLHHVYGMELYIKNSFPSGHTITAFSIGLLLTYFSKDKRWALLWFVIACSVGYSRMYLAQHFFTDLYGGSIIGVVTTYIAIALGEKYKPVLRKDRHFPWICFTLASYRSKDVSAQRHH